MSGYAEGQGVKRRKRSLTRESEVGDLPDEMVGQIRQRVGRMAYHPTQYFKRINPEKIQPLTVDNVKRALKYVHAFIPQNASGSNQLFEFGSRLGEHGHRIENIVQKMDEVGETESRTRGYSEYVSELIKFLTALLNRAVLSANEDVTRFLLYDVFGDVAIDTSAFNQVLARNSRSRKARKFIEMLSKNAAARESLARYAISTLHLPALRQLVDHGFVMGPIEKKNLLFSEVYGSEHNYLIGLADTDMELEAHAFIDEVGEYLAEERIGPHEEPIRWETNFDFRSNW